MSTTQKQRIIEVVNSIPQGKVSSYGEVGKCIGISGWEVGRILSGLKEDEWSTVAWQRVVAKNGYLSSMKLGFRGNLQKQMLIDEGVKVEDDMVDMNKFGISLTGFGVSV